jgi:hypothetical protein
VVRKAASPHRCAVLLKDFGNDNHEVALSSLAR